MSNPNAVIKYYGTVSKLVHWLIAFLVISMIFLGYFMFDIPDKKTMGQVVSLHKLTGLLILVLMIFRVIWALTHPKPLELPYVVPYYQRILERSVHFLFYSILIIMPLTGWLMSVTAGHPPTLFSFTFALPVAENKIVSNYWENIHNTLAIVLIILISLHVLAAFYHYFIKKDDVLQRML